MVVDVLYRDRSVHGSRCILGARHAMLSATMINDLDSLQDATVDFRTLFLFYSFLFLSFVPVREILSSVHPSVTCQSSKVRRLIECLRDRANERLSATKGKITRSQSGAKELGDLTNSVKVHSCIQHWNTLHVSLGNRAEGQIQATPSNASIMTRAYRSRENRWWPSRRPLRLCVPVSPRDGVNYTHNTTDGHNIFGLNYYCNGDRVVTEKINNKGKKITTYHVFKSRPIFRSSELKPSRGGVWSETRGNGRNSQVVSLLFLFFFLPESGNLRTTWLPCMSGTLRGSRV